jgi:hypothetical protein
MDHSRCGLSLRWPDRVHCSSQKVRELTDRSDPLDGYVFISHGANDGELADEIHRRIEAAGVRVWRVSSNLMPGDDYRQVIRRTITKHAFVFLACFSSRSVKNAGIQNEELNIAFSEMLRRSPDQSWLIPVRFDACQIPSFEIGGGRTIESITSADLFGPDCAVQTEKLVRSVLRILDNNDHLDQRTAQLPGREALTGLFHILAAIAGDLQGKQIWNGLTAIVADASAVIEPPPAGEAELRALRDHPTPDRADALAGVVVERAAGEARFRGAIGEWLGQPTVRAIQGTVSRPSLVGRDKDAEAKAIQATTSTGRSGQSGRRWPKLSPRLRVVTISGALAAAVAVVLVLTLPNNGGTGVHAGSKGPLAPNTSHSPAASATGPAASRTSNPPTASSPSIASSSILATASGSPARVIGVTPLTTLDGDSRAAADDLHLSKPQLTAFNSDYAASGIGSPATRRFLASIGAVPVADAFTSITVEGNYKGTVAITDLQIVKHCTAPLIGTYFYSPIQGLSRPIPVGFDLDSYLDYAQHVARGSHGLTFTGNVFQEKNVTLRPGELSTFGVYVWTALHFCRFYFQMTVATPSGPPVLEKIDIDNDGEPFELTAVANPPTRYHSIYIGGTASPHDGDFVKIDPKNFPG